jgi:hypothetical protein
MIHCIVRVPRRSSVSPGAGLRWIDGDGIGALIGDVDPSELPAASNTRLQSYADVVARIHMNEVLIPMRFGCVLTSDDSVRELLVRYRERLLSQLEHVGDCAEFGIRLLLPEASAASTSGDDPAFDRGENGGRQSASGASAGPGLAHLTSIRLRLDRELLVTAEARVARTAIEALVSGLFREVRDELGQIAGRHLMSLYFLVPREQGDAFVESLRQDASSVVGAGLMSGPWPPYNFVGAIDDDLRSLA